MYCLSKVSAHPGASHLMFFLFTQSFGVCVCQSIINHWSRILYERSTIEQVAANMLPKEEQTSPCSARIVAELGGKSN